MTNPEYVVIGGGTAGCVLAARLSEDPDTHVLLLEAGPNEGPEHMSDPNSAFGLWGSAVDWSYWTAPQPGTGGAVHRWPLGKVLGGSSAINMMLHLRGHHASYDAWEKLGAEGWNYCSLLPHLRNSETAEGRDPLVRGSDGPMVIPRPDPLGPLQQAWHEAVLEAGHATSDDGNGSVAEGISSTEMNVVDDRRQSAADAYLRPALGRSNLTVVTDAQVRRLLVDGKRCVGVEYTKGGRMGIVHAEREVLLCAGTVGSPHLLMLSGIGNGGDLRDVGIEVRAHLPGVGQNLHDHVMNWVNYAPARPMHEGGPYNNRPHLLCRSSRDADPDLQLILAPMMLGPRWSSVDPEGFAIVFALLNPFSRGSLQLNTADVRTAPVIDPAYLTDERDMDRMMAGLQEARRIGAAPALSAWRGAELTPGPDIEDAEDLRHYIRSTAGTYFHPVGTCRIGVDDLAVVDPELRVHGVEGLRIADASVMPAVVSANTNATVLAIAERAASLLRPRVTRPPRTGRTTGDSSESG